MVNKTGPWSDEEEADLLALKAEGAILGKICKQLRRSPGAVCGKWNRMNGYKVPRERKTRNGDRTAWTDESLTQRWSDRKK